MKWKNPGNEFDSIGNYISSLQEIYIFGAGTNGEFVCKTLNEDIKIKAFIDNDINKRGTKYLGLPVIGLDELPDQIEGSVIVVAVSQSNTPIILKQLVGEGFIPNQNLFPYWQFVQYFEMYRNNKVYLTGCTFSITEKCSLNCEKCSILTPFIEKPKHYELKDLKSDVDKFFVMTDYICVINLLGGEPFLYPYLADIIEYIGNNYKNKIGNVTLTTNGMIMPKEEVIQAMKKNHIIVTISDYRRSLPHIAEKVAQFIECLANNEIKYIIDTVEHWIDFGYDYINRETSTEEELCDVFEQCKTPCRLVQDGKYYYCANSKFAINAGLLKNDVENEFDLRAVDDRNKKRLLEFELGYNNRGYLELCKRCNGYLTINKNFIDVAKQSERKCNHLL
ncbi:MAG: radical SAM protein [Mobilitalea sp.]